MFRIFKNYKDKLKYFFINNKSKNFFYNLYCNTLLKKVKNGYIMFLDDDDKFYSNSALSEINEKLKI